MQELINYISDILNIKTDSVYTIQDITEELSKIRDIAAYRSYIKNNIKTIDFASGYQKFLLLTQQYLQLEYLALNPTVKDQAERITSLAFAIITNGNYNYSAEYTGETEDKKLLSSIGNPKTIQKLLDNDLLENEIIKKIIETDNPLIYQQLPQRMSQMLANTTKAIK